MEPPPKIRKPDEKNCLFTEGIDYSKTGKESIWGPEEKETLELLKKTEFHGKWLNLAAGDGRYNQYLLEKADFLVASDADESALQKLWQNTPVRLRKNLSLKTFSIAKRFPFEDKSFDGVFCTGTFHLFPRIILPSIFSEIDRILRPGGRIIIDFATDVKRVLPDGRLYHRPAEQKYGLKETEKLLKNMLKNYMIFELMKAEVPEEEIKSKDITYIFSCRFILLAGNKN